MSSSATGQQDSTYTGVMQRLVALFGMAELASQLWPDRQLADSQDSISAVYGD